MPATPTYGLPFPALTEAPDGPAQVQALALGVEAELVRVDNDVENAVTDTGLLTNLGVTNETGWSVTVKEHRIMGGVMFLRLGFDRTGAALEGSVNSNVADTPICTITSAAMRPQVTQEAHIRFSNCSGGGELSSSTGTLTLTDIPNGGDIATSNTGQVNFVYPLP